MAVKTFTAGEVLTAADLNDTIQYARAGRRNLLYNGAMQVHQRGTSTTGITASGYYTADRWSHNVVSMGTWTNTIENDAPAGSGLSKSLKVLCTTADSTPAASDQTNVDQRIEGQNVQRIAKGTSSAQQLTLSFWVKSNVTGIYVVSLFDLDNSRQVGATYSVSTSDTWERKTITFPADTTGAFDNDNAASLITRWWLGAGTDRTSGTLRTDWTSTLNADVAVGQTNLAAATNNYWQITGVQLEVGAVATEFEFKSYGQELAECQRYYYRLNADIAGSKAGAGFNRTTTSAISLTTFPVTMRIAPTAVEQSGTATDYSVLHLGIFTTCSAVPTYSNANKNSGDVTLTVASGLTAGDGSLGRFTTLDGYLAWSAEL